MKAILARQDDNTIQLTISIPADLVQKAWDEEVGHLAKSASVEGFRKGKAPRKVIEERIDKDKLKEDVLKKLLPTAYLEAIKEHNLKPIMNPKIHVSKLEEGKDWEISAITCENPKVTLNTYKDAIAKITAKSKIIVPGKEEKEPDFNEILKALMDSTTIAVPQVLLDAEVERLLSQLLDEVKKLGLSLDQYLASTNKTGEALRNDYQKKAETDIKLEFVLQKIAEEEHITVEQKEIDEAIQKAKDPEERKHLEANSYLLTNILRQQKTLDFLKQL